MKIHSSKLRGFTLIEMMVTLVIIGILAGMLMISYREGQENLKLQQAAAKLAQDIRRIQEYALASSEIDNDIPNRGYGLYFHKDYPAVYRFFANIKDYRNDQYYYYNPSHDGSFKEIMELEDGIIIVPQPDGIREGLGTQERARNRVAAVFIPPDPSTFIGWYNRTAKDYLKITLGLENDHSKRKTVTIYRSGLVDVD